MFPSSCRILTPFTFLCRYTIAVKPAETEKVFGLPEDPTRLRKKRPGKGLEGEVDPADIDEKQQPFDCKSNTLISASSSRLTRII